MTQRVAPNSTANGAAPGAVSSDQILRSLIIRLGALTAVLLIVAQGVVSYLSAEAFEESLFPEILANAEVAGELVAAQIGYAVSIGIPLDSLVEMDAFLDGVLQRNPDLLFLAVADTEEAVLYARGAEAMPDLSAPDARPNSLELSVPILAESERVGELRIGVREGSVLEVFSELRFDILTVLLGTLFVAVELLVAFVVVKFSGPIQHSYNVLAMGARGNFAYQIGIRSRDEVGKFASAYNAAVRRINNAFAELLNEAEDAQSVQLERSVQDRISSIVAEVRARFQFSPPGSEEAVPVRSPMDVRIPLFIFMLSQELSRPFLPLFFDQIYTPIAGLSREVAIGLPITAFMLTALVATPVTGALTDRFAPRAIFLAERFRQLWGTSAPRFPRASSRCYSGGSSRASVTESFSSPRKPMLRTIRTGGAGLAEWRHSPEPYTRRSYAAPRWAASLLIAWDTNGHWSLPAFSRRFPPWLP